MRSRSTTAPPRLMLPGADVATPRRWATPTASREVTPRASRAALRDAPLVHAPAPAPRIHAEPTEDVAAATLLSDIIDELIAQDRPVPREQLAPLPPAQLRDAAEHIEAALALLTLQSGPALVAVPTPPALGVPFRSVRRMLARFPLPPQHVAPSNQGGTEAGPSGTSGRAAPATPRRAPSREVLPVPSTSQHPPELGPWLAGGRPEFFADNGLLGAGSAGARRGSSDTSSSLSVHVGTDGQLLVSHFSDFSASSDSIATSSQSGTSYISSAETSFVFGGMLPSQFDGSDGQRSSGRSGYTFLRSSTVYSQGSSREDDVG